MNKIKGEYATEEQRNENLMTWVGFWRKNVHRFVIDYLQINLKWFQILIIYLIDKYPTFMWIASRGASKSFMLALYSVVRCILYPGTKVKIASKTIPQASVIIDEKVMELYRMSPAVRSAIGSENNIKNNNNKGSSVEFLNGSTISVVTASDSARGNRANLLVIDEFVHVDKDVIDSVLKPMATVMRQPPYLNKREYKNYPKEENKTVYISSAWYKSHWSWKQFEQYINDTTNDDGQVLAISSAYSLPLNNGLLSQNKLEQDRTDFDNLRFQMEYESIFVGQAGTAYYNLEEIMKNRTIKNAFIPPTDEEVRINNRRSQPKRLTNVPRLDDTKEVRLVALDVALKGGNKEVDNDSSAFTLMRLIPEKGVYRRDVMYLESIIDSASANDLTVRLKQLYYDFEADYVIIDAHGIGVSVVELATTVLYDEKRDIEYEPWKIINDENENIRLNATGLPVIYTMHGSARLNSEIATGLKRAFEDRKLKLPIEDTIMRTEFITQGGFLKLSVEEQQRKLYPYLQATALTNELVSLEYEILSGNIKIKEVGRMTKDRYSSLAYCNYYADVLERELRQKDDGDSMSDFIFVSPYQM